MTRKRLNLIILLITIFYVIAIIAAILLRSYDTTSDLKYYQTLIDIIPLLFAIPLGYLGFCFNKRNESVANKKELWNLLVDAVNDAIHSTYQEKISTKEYQDNLKSLSKIIDKIRAEYKNIGASEDSVGFYPFEPVKSIYEVYYKMGYKNLTEEIRKQTRDKMSFHWKAIRESFLHEIDRNKPERPIILSKK